MEFRGTTILAVKKDGKVAMAGDGQVTLDKTVMKGHARKVRKIYDGKILVGFAGATADAFTLFDDDRGHPVFNQSQGAEKSGRAGTDDDAVPEDRRQISWWVFGGCIGTAVVLSGVVCILVLRNRREQDG